MTSCHPEFSEYATCAICGMKKLCRLDGRHFVCYSCANKNFKGLRRINHD